MRVFGDFLRDQKVTRRRHPRPQAENPFAKGNAPSGGPTFCARQKVGKERAKGGPPIMGSPFGILSLITGQSQPLNDPGRQSPELSGATHPRWRAAAVDDAVCPPIRALRGAVAKERDTKPKPSVSGFGLERRRNGMSLLSHLCGSKGYGICADVAAAKLEAASMQVCCAELSLPVLPSERERKYIETFGVYARLW